MIKKIWLLLNTVRYLKPIQIYFQIFYRLKPYRNLTHYIENSGNLITPNFLHFYEKTFPKGIVTENKKFTFLNQEKIFIDDIDWDFQGFGKLWNYNLQYFNFLNDSNLPQKTKLSWLLDIGSWLKNGKLKLEPYPVSLRLINSIRFCSKEKITNECLYAEMKGQASYLNRHLEYHLLGNHLLENAFALLMSGYFFDQRDWQRTAKSILYQELEEQVLEDGCHFELSPMYHQIILFRMLELIDWYSKLNDNQAFLDFLNQKANKMCAFLKEMTFSNGDIPHFNDSATGIALNSAQLLAYARCLGITDDATCHLTDSGYRSFNQSSYKCIVDVGAVGPTYQPGHSHADALSFIIYYKGSPLFVEAGTSTYQIGEKRNFERSTAAHNTVVVGNMNQSQVWGGFRVGKRAKVNVIEDNICAITATHDGYLSNFGVLHKRSYHFSNSSILIQDDIGGESGIAYFHIHPSCHVSIVNDVVIFVDLNLTLSFSPTVAVSIEEYQFANGFNDYKCAKKVVVSFDKKLTSTIKF